MIDRTSTRIEQQETALRRHNRRRYAFQRMLEATDRVLWRLEEMNRDGTLTFGPVVVSIIDADQEWTSEEAERLADDVIRAAEFARSL